MSRRGDYAPVRAPFTICDTLARLMPYSLAIAAFDGAGMRLEIRMISRSRLARVLARSSSLDMPLFWALVVETRKRKLPLDSVVPLPYRSPVDQREAQMTLQQIAKAILENSDAVNRRAITWKQFSRENHRLWRLADRGELLVMGNAASRRCAKVHAYLRSM